MNLEHHKVSSREVEELLPMPMQILPSLEKQLQSKR